MGDCNQPLPRMHHETENASIGMIAHDFTGALDSLVAFVEKPGDTFVLLQSGDLPEGVMNVAVVAPTQTLSPEEAYEGVRRAARRLPGRRLFKRVGSTLRGNIGAEIRAVIDETGTRALVCPALPREGRTVVDGIGLLDSVPLHLTEYGNDPTTPCRESSLLSILRGGGVDASLVPLRVVRRGEEAVLRQCISTSSEAVVVDAETDEDMRAIARVLAALGTGWCACASSGLSPHLAEALGRRRGARHILPPCSASKALAVIGSMSMTSAAQVARVRELADSAVVRMEALELCANGPEVALWEEKARAELDRGYFAVLTTSLSAVVPDLRNEVAPTLGALAARIIRGGVTVAVLSGGLTALHTCLALGIPSVQVLGEVEPGVVCSRGTDSDGLDRTLVSKAGGFGDAGALARLLGV